MPHRASGAATTGCQKQFAHLLTGSLSSSRPIRAIRRSTSSEWVAFTRCESGCTTGHSPSTPRTGFFGSGSEPTPSMIASSANTQMQLLGAFVSKEAVHLWAWRVQECVQRCPVGGQAAGS